MTVRWLGRFRELDSGLPDDPSLRAAVGQLGQDVQQVANYLRSAPRIGGTTEPAVDVLDPSSAEIGPSDIRTDGGWVWLSELAHYVSVYAVGLPDEFLAHARSRGWQPPDMTVDERAAVIDAVVADDEDQAFV